jgi:hypothetical protein
MYNDFDDAWEATITQVQARAEIRKHGSSWDEFVSEEGLSEHYKGSQVLGYLGY